MDRVCVVGLGYIGLPTAALAASHGLRVTGVDIDPEVVRSLSGGRAHFAEPELDDVVERVIREGLLTAQGSPSPADVFLIAVPTPVNEDKTADLSFVRSAVRSILPSLEKGNLVIVESTIPPGTTEEEVVPILAETGLEVGDDLFVAHCPERVLPGRILDELVHNDRVIGGVNKASALKAAEFYRMFVQGSVIITTARTAETVKLVENAYRDVNIAFANELSLLCERLGVGVWDVIKLANRHPRVNILSPGPGVGGHCIAVDPWFLVEKAPEAASLIAAARKVNDSMPEYTVSRVASAVPEGSKVACLGVAYKADVGDTRESPALKVICGLRNKGYQVSVVDPHVASCDGLSLVPLEEALADADCVVLLVDHSEFKRLDLTQLRKRFDNGRLIDTRGVWSDGTAEPGAVDAAADVLAPERLPVDLSSLAG